MNKEIFLRECSKYTLYGKQLRNGVISSTIARDAVEIDLSAPPEFLKFYTMVKEGMSGDFAFQLWSEICSGPHMYKYEYWMSYEPDPDDWFLGGDGLAYGFKDGRVVRTNTGMQVDRIDIGNAARKALQVVAAGDTVESVRKRLLQKCVCSRRCAMLYNFTPPISHRANALKQESAVRQPKKLATKDSLPPLLSTNKCDIRVLRQNGVPVQVIVVLYTLMRAWQDERRTLPDPAIKNNVNWYFEFASKCILDSQHAYMFDRLKPNRVRLTRDCCLECDFDVVRKAGE